uniref:Peptidyl-prolyl cis-trans isomerase CYP23 n=1 Tax=Rhizophora mucronata TaxID=61149 RepID=A0A2P2KNX6_RHIMU
MNEEQRREAKKTIVGEFSDVKHVRGILSMGRSSPFFFSNFLSINNFIALVCSSIGNELLVHLVSFELSIEEFSS